MLSDALFKIQFNQDMILKSFFKTIHDFIRSLMIRYIYEQCNCDYNIIIFLYSDRLLRYDTLLYNFL